MLAICQICLRTDKKLEVVESSLANWHDELCDFGVEDYVQFCSECSYLLKKFLDFKKQCILATKVLNNWKKQKVGGKKPLSQLHNQLPNHPCLSLSNKNSQKMFHYQLDEIPTLMSVENVSKYPHIIMISIANDHVNTTPPEFDYEVDKSTIKELEVKQEFEFQPDIVVGDLETVVFDFKNDIEIDHKDHDVVISDNDSEFSEFDLEKLLKDTTYSDMDSSDDDIIKPKKPKRSLADLVKEEKVDGMKPAKKKKVRSKKPPNLEALKHLLLTKFANHGDVKDAEGNIIDKDCIVNSLDKMHIYTLNQVKNRITGSSKLTPEAIEVLSRVQKKYGNQYASVFTIEHLPTKEHILAEFAKRKHYEVYVNAEHKCELCYRGFKYRKQLDYHVKVFHDPDLPHYCTVCQMRFKSRHSLLKHRAGHRAVYKCKLCPLVTNYRTAMVNHYHQHKGVVYRCELCVGIFKSKSCLSAHMNYMHQSQYICGMCARTFASDAGLGQHRIRTHDNQVVTEGPETRSCERCDVLFVSEEVYQKHLHKSHAEDNSGYYVYKKRKRVAPRTKPNFVCRVCKKVEHSFGRLQWHFKCEHPTENYEVLYSDLHKHLCHVCGKGYANITDLTEHKHLHTGARPYACDKCPKAFHRKLNLRNHLERHLPPARECQQCGKKFVSAANLNNHMKMHIGARHFVCEICAKTFLHRCSLNAHIRGVHHHIRRVRKNVKPME